MRSERAVPCTGQRLRPALPASVPGTSVLNFMETDTGVAFVVEGDEDAQITVGLMDDTEYEVFIDEKSMGTMKTGLGGKLSLSVELETAGEVPVRIVQA